MTSYKKLLILLSVLFVSASLYGAEALTYTYTPENGTMFTSGTDVTFSFTATPNFFDSYLSGVVRQLTIYSTTDGSDPKVSTSRSTNTLAFNKSFLTQTKEITIASLSSTTTLKLYIVAQKSSFVTYNFEEELTLNYTHITPPIITPASCNFSTPISLSIISSCPGQPRLQYTLDGTGPSFSTAQIYTEPITIDETTKVRAVAIFEKNGKTYYTGETQAMYTCISPLGQPAITPENGARLMEDTRNEGIQVVITSPEANAAIYYTTDNSIPVNPSKDSNPAQNRYNGPFTIAKHGYTTINAIAVTNTRPDSKVTSSTFYLIRRSISPEITIFNNNIPVAEAEAESIFVAVDKNTANVSFSIKNLDPQNTVHYHVNGAQHSIAPGDTATGTLADTATITAQIPDSQDTESCQSSVVHVKFIDETEISTRMATVDLNGNGIIEIGDFSILKSLWNTAGIYQNRTADTNKDGIIDQHDLDLMQSLWWCSTSGISSMPKFNSSFLVIDVSAGPDALSYPYQFTSAIPAGGWNQDTYKTDKIVFAYIPVFNDSNGVTFTMGSPEDEVARQLNNDQTSQEDQYKVTLTHPFFMGIFEVTQQQWYNVMGTWPSYFSKPEYRPMRPVDSVSFYNIRGSAKGRLWPKGGQTDPNSFLGILRAKTGLTELELPTEAQWELACRAGTTTPFSCVSDQAPAVETHKVTNLDLYARYKPVNFSSDKNADPAKGGTAIVGSFYKNNFGLYDMHGNVSELCLDLFGDYPEISATDPKGASSGTMRVIRGGSINSYAHQCRSAARDSVSQSSNLRKDVGFRLSFWLPF